MKLHNKTRGLLALLSLLSAVLCTAFITGCGGNAPDNTDPASPTGDIRKDVALELITKVAINEALDGDKEIAGYIDTGTTLFIDALDGGEITLPSQVDEAVKSWITETDLEPTTKASLSSAYDILKRHYLARIDAGQLDPAKTAPIRTIATWVRDAARDTIRFGADFDGYDAPAIPQESAEKYNLGTTETIWILRILMFWLSDDDSDEVGYSATYEAPLDESLWGYLASSETRKRYPLFGDPPAKVDPKWHDGLRHMLANPR